MVWLTRAVTTVCVKGNSYANLASIMSSIHVKNSLFGNSMYICIYKILKENPDVFSDIYRICSTLVYPRVLSQSKRKQEI